MKIFKKEFRVDSDKRYQLVEITDRVKETVKESGVSQGACLVFVGHSTAALLLTENESGLKQDMIMVLKNLVSGFDFLHDRIDNNADSHILSALIGQSRSLIIENGQPVLGTWQQVFLVELDGPRQRRVSVEIHGE